MKTGYILFFTLMFAGYSLSAPVAIAEGEGIRLTLTDEPCRLDAVRNLKYRATWVDSRGTYEGCWGRQLGGQVVSLYFDDKNVSSLPASIFKPASGI